MPAKDWLQVRVSEAERKTLDSVLAGLVEEYPAFTRASVLRAAVRIGLAEIRRRPQTALVGAAKPITGKNSTR